MNAQGVCSCCGWICAKYTGGRFRSGTSDDNSAEVGRRREEIKELSDLVLHLCPCSLEVYR